MISNGETELQVWVSLDLFFRKSSYQDFQFEELFNQFIPSDPSLRGWVKVAWQQPVFSVGGVVKELITKTQWGRLGKVPDTTSPSVERRMISRQPSEDDRIYPLPDSSESVSADNHPFPAQMVGGSARSSEDAAVRQPRQRTISRPRLVSLFRRAETPKQNMSQTVNGNH